MCDIRRRIHACPNYSMSRNPQPATYSDARQLARNTQRRQTTCPQHTQTPANTPATHTDARQHAGTADKRGADLFQTGPSLGFRV